MPVILAGAASSSFAQSSVGGLVNGQSETEQLQLQEMSRTNQANIKALQADSQSLTKNAVGVGFVMGTGFTALPAVQPASSFNNYIWSDNQGVWKLDKFGKQCAVSSSSSSSSSSDPCS
ncbi:MULTISPECIES: hypothetical protein [Cyanobium]|uniref:hypothetical protein n=1 Tax=Cyanobium TaxID=167375 RepID=UPI0012902289|nr:MULTISPECIES: hypothetical protein [Cyanobium]